MAATLLVALMSSPVRPASAWCIGAPEVDGLPVVEPVLDQDSDGLNNLQEALLGTDPERADSDADGVPDADEVVDGVRHLDRPSLFSLERFADPAMPAQRQILVLEGTNLFASWRSAPAMRRDGISAVRVEETGARRVAAQRRRGNNHNRIALRLSNQRAQELLGPLPAHLFVRPGNRRRTNSLKLMDMNINCASPKVMGAALIRITTELDGARTTHEYIGIGGCGLVRAAGGAQVETTVVLTDHAVPVEGEHRITLRAPTSGQALLGARILTPLVPRIRPDALNPLPLSGVEIRIGDRLTVVRHRDDPTSDSPVVVTGLIADLTIPEHNLDEDHDGDGVSSAAELRAGTDPLVFDTDRDGLPDGLEPRLGLDPNDPDSDDDGVGDGGQVQAAVAPGPLSLWSSIAPAPTPAAWSLAELLRRPLRSRR